MKQDGRKRELVIRQPLAEFIDEVNPPVHLSCDFLGDVMALGLMIHPPIVYERIEELKHARNPSSGSQRA